MYDDSGCLYAGRKTDAEGRPAALILLQVYLPDEERIRRRTRDRFSRLEPALDLFLDVVDFIVDIVT